MRRAVSRLRGQRAGERSPGRVEPLHPAPPDPALGRLRVDQEPLQVVRRIHRVERRQRLALGDDRPQQQPFSLAPIRAAGRLAARTADLDPGAHRLQVGVEFGLVRRHGRPVQPSRAIELGRHAQRLERRHVGRGAPDGPQGRVPGRQLPAWRHGQ